MNNPMTDLAMLRLERTEYHRAFLKLKKQNEQRHEERNAFLKETKERWEAYVNGTLSGKDKDLLNKFDNACSLAHEAAGIAGKAYRSADWDYRVALSKISQN